MLLPGLGTNTDKTHTWIDVGDHTLDEEATRKDEYLQKRTIDTILNSHNQLILHSLEEHGAKLIGII